MKTLLILTMAGVLVLLGLAASIVLRPLPEQGRGPQGAPSAAPTVSIVDWQGERERQAERAQEALHRRLLFTPGREPRSVGQAEPVERAAPVSAPSITLQGTVLSGQTRVAILIDPARTDPVFATAGTRLSGGWSVETVEHGRVTLARAGRSVDLHLEPEGSDETVGAGEGGADVVPVARQAADRRRSPDGEDEDSIDWSQRYFEPD